MSRPIRFGLPFIAALFIAATAPVGGAAQVASTDYCVTCKGPAETYRCRVQGREATPSDALKLYCVIRTAKEGGHASCSAKKATTGCVGLVKVYSYDGPALPENISSDPRVRDLNRKIEREQRAYEEPSGDAPSSLFELGGRAVDASRRGLRNAGSAIGLGSSSDSEDAPLSDQPLPLEDLPESENTETANPDPDAFTTQADASDGSDTRGFARRSYDCMISFFRDCGRRE